MYEAPKKMDLKKKIELGILLVAIFWGVLFVINYMRYSDSKPPLLSLKVVDDNYDDGKVIEYISLGYIYRSYQREAINKEEFVPFWVLKERPDVEPDLPKPYTGYEVPENISAEDKFRGLLYYFDNKRKTVGTYKCINTLMDCNKAFSGHDKYNLSSYDVLSTSVNGIVIGNIHEKFAFVDDSLGQDAKYGDSNYSRTIYLYQFLEEDPQILAKFADVKASTIDDIYNVGYGVDNKYIVKSMSNDKWGIIHISEKGTITEELPYEYDSITYDIDTNYYIVCKNDVWFVYDLNNNKVVSAESVEPIYDVWRNGNMTYYFKTGRHRTVGNESFTDYNLYRMDGSEFLVKDRVTAILPRDKYIMYLTNNDKVLHFIDYSTEEKHKIKLYFTDLSDSQYTNPAFEINYEKKGVITFKVYKQRSNSNEYDYVSVNTQYWDYN